MQIAEAVQSALTPSGAAVVVKAEHMCMTMRGVRKSGSQTVTAHFTGVLDEPANRNEVLALL